MQKLSIVIPTYNRKEKLLRQLHCILDQPESKLVNDITVLNNHSNYDCEGVVYAEFPKDQYFNLTVITHPYNVGGNMNISLCFYYAKADWMWMMSDDDTATGNSIKTILRNIEEHKDDIVIKYSLGNTVHKDVHVDSLNGLVDYYKDNHLFQGELIFMSNGVYNLTKLQPVVGEVIEYGYNSMPAILPMFFGLDKNLGKIYFSSKYIINYSVPEMADGEHDWTSSYNSIMGRVVSLFDYPFNCNGKTMLRLLTLQDHWSPYLCIRSLYRSGDKKKMKIFHDRIFPYTYQFSGLRRLKVNLIYFFFYYFDIDIKKTFKNK